MEIQFGYDKQHNKLHYQVNHNDITENKILEVFSNPFIKIEKDKHAYKIIGHTNLERFLMIIGVCQSE
jgi:hypothetical protein